MLYVFHGEDVSQSRNALNTLISKLSTTNILRLLAKQTNLETVNLFLNSSPLFIEPKLLVLENFFSVSKPVMDKIIPIIQSNISENIIIFQDKILTTSQLKIFPQATIHAFKASNLIWGCINSVKPGNLAKFITLYEQMLKQEPIDLFLYLLKSSIRKNILTSYPLTSTIAKKTYLQLIELDYQNKTGRLSIPKELALQRIITNALSANIN